jgi:murein DD-endopeptidase MepM/ murein hydrolase activator NlpD
VYPVGKATRQMQRLRSYGAVLILPFTFSLLLLLAPVLPAVFRPAPTASAAALPAATPTPVTAGQAAVAQAIQTTTTAAREAPTSSPAPTQVSTAAQTPTQTATVEQARTPEPPSTSTLPSARPLNAPEAVAGASTTASKPTPTVPAPTPTPSSPYRLPWPGGETLNVIQGNNSAFSHSGIEAYAWDFSMPTGSIIEAARGGTVRYVREDSNAGGDDVNLFGWAGNYLVIDHGDGTSGLYMHLMYHGALVSVGQKVQQGEPIALSGGTGFATGPHLHFMVERTEPGSWYDQSLPATFADVASDGGVPKQNQTYTSGNAAAAYWQSGNVVNRVELPAVDLPRPAASVVPGVQGTGVFAWPLAGPVISPATAQQPVVLVGGAAGANVLAADTGTVVFAGTEDVSVTVVIDHGNGYLTVYARLLKALVLPGDIVQRGQPIGVLGQLIPGLPVHVAVMLYDHGQPVDAASRFRSGLGPAPLPQVQAPNLVGMTAAEVAKAVAGLPITVAVDPPASSATVAAGLVASQQPAAGSLIDIRSVIHTTPSDGPPTPSPTSTSTATPPSSVTAAPSAPSATPAASPTAGHAAPAPATATAGATPSTATPRPSNTASTPPPTASATATARATVTVAATATTRPAVAATTTSAAGTASPSATGVTKR